MSLITRSGGGAVLEGAEGVECVERGLVFGGWETSEWPARHVCMNVSRMSTALGPLLGYK